MTARISPLVSRLALPLLALLALIGALACDDGESNAQDGTPTGTAAAETSTPEGDATATPSGAGTPSTGAGGGGGEDSDQFSRALQLALEGDGIGSEASQDEITPLDIDVMPDGTGLPAGSGTHADGEPLYMTQCAPCHGQQGEGGIGPQLIVENAQAWQPGDPTVIGNYWPYATTVWDYIRRAMPFFEPGSLSEDEVYAVTAYLLAENGVIQPDMELNQDNLADVEMPAADIFNECWPDECYPDHDPYPGGGGGTGGGTATATPTGTGTAEGTPAGAATEEGAESPTATGTAEQ